MPNANHVAGGKEWKVWINWSCFKYWEHNRPNEILLYSGHPGIISAWIIICPNCPASCNYNSNCITENTTRCSFCRFSNLTDERRGTSPARMEVVAHIWNRATCFEKLHGACTKRTRRRLLYVSTCFPLNKNVMHGLQASQSHICRSVLLCQQFTVIKHSN